MTEAKAADVAAPGEPPRGDISPKLTTRTRLEHGLLVPMRDGTRLSLDLIRPELPNPLPVVLVRTPYDKVLERSRRADFYVSLAQRGYIVAVQDCRGRFNSDGEFFPYFDESDDGYDTVEWVGCSGVVRRQRRHDGRLLRRSDAVVRRRQEPAVPQGDRSGRLAARRSLHKRADLERHASCWRSASGWRDMGRRAFQNSEFLEIFTEDQSYFDALPLADLPRLAGSPSRWWDEMMQHPNFDDFWKRGSYDDWSSISTPALNLTGWYDMNFCGAPRNFEAMRAHGGTDDARSGQKLIIGPWPHWVNTHRRLNGIDFGEHAIVELDDYIVRFFDRWLKGERNGIDDEKPVYVFVMGANEWRAEDEWPLPGTEYVPFYLHSGGHANSLQG